MSEWWSRQQLWVRVLLVIAIVAVLFAACNQVVFTDTDQASAFAHDGGGSHKSQVHPKYGKKKGARMLRTTLSREWRKATYIQFNAKNGVGWWMFSHRMDARWSYNGRRVWNVSFRQQDSTSWWTHWHVSYRYPQVSGGGKNYRYKRGRYQWQGCWPVIGICTHSYTWVSMTVRKDGTWTADAGRG